MRDVMFAVVWMIALPMSVVSPYSGVLLWVWVALLSPNELLYGFMAGVPLNKLVALTTLPLILFSKDRKDFYLDSIFVLLLLLGLTGTISWFVTIVPTDDGTELYLKLIKILVLTFCISAIITTRLRLHQLLLAVVVALSFLGVKEGLISLLTAGGHQIVGSLSIGDNNSLAAALLMIVPLAYYLARYSAVSIVRVTMMVITGLCIVTTVMTFSRGGFIGLLVLGAMMIKNSRNKAVSLILVVITAVLVYSLAPASWFERLNTIESAGEDSSFMGRVVAWKISVLIALDHPLFGGGFHAVQRGLVWSYYRPFLPSLDFIRTPPADVFPHAAHSIYFEVLGDLGFIGFILFMTLLVMSLWRTRQIVRLARRVPRLQWAGDLARMFQISMVVYVVTAGALSMAYFELFYVLVAMISRCYRTALQEAAALSPEVSLPVRARPGAFVPGPLATRNIGTHRPAQSR